MVNKLSQVKLTTYYYQYKTRRSNRLIAHIQFVYFLFKRKNIVLFLGYTLYMYPLGLYYDVG